MARVRLFASAREAAGRRADEVEATTLGGLLAVAVERYGAEFAALLPSCRVWVNGEPAGEETPLTNRDEVAILPPVSGG